MRKNAPVFNFFNFFFFFVFFFFFSRNSMIYPDRFGTNVRKTQEENTCSTQDGWLAAMDTSAARAWLHGVAYGPGVHISQKQLVERLPAGYELRQYPGKRHFLCPPT